MNVHTCCAFMSMMGKRFLGSGFEDILIESEIVAPGSLQTVISGHKYNRSIRVHKIMFEALHRLQIQAFMASLTEQDHDMYSSLIERLPIQQRNFMDCLSLQRSLLLWSSTIPSSKNAQVKAWHLRFGIPIWSLSEHSWYLSAPHESQTGPYTWQLFEPCCPGSFPMTG